MSSYTKKSAILQELEHAIKRKITDKSKAKEQTNKILQQSVEKRTQLMTAKQVSRENRVVSSFKTKESKVGNYQGLATQTNNNNNAPVVSLFGQEQLSTELRTGQKKTTCRRWQKLLSLINYTLSSSDKAIKYISSSNFEAQFAIKLFRSDRENLVNQLRSMDLEEMLMQIKPRKDNKEGVELQEENIRLRKELALLEKEMQYMRDGGGNRSAIGSGDSVGGMYEKMVGEMVEEKAVRKIQELLLKERKFESMLGKCKQGDKKIEQLRDILGALAKQRRETLCSSIKQPFIKQLQRHTTRLQVQPSSQPQTSRSITKIKSIHQQKQLLQSQIMKLKQQVEQVKNIQKIQKQNGMLKKSHEMLYKGLNGLLGRIENNGIKEDGEWDEEMGSARERNVVERIEQYISEKEAEVQRNKQALVEIRSAVDAQRVQNDRLVNELVTQRDSLYEALQQHKQKTAQHLSQYKEEIERLNNAILYLETQESKQLLSVERQYEERIERMERNSNDLETKVEEKEERIRKLERRVKEMQGEVQRDTKLLEEERVKVRQLEERLNSERKLYEEKVNRQIYSSQQLRNQLQQSQHHLQELQSTVSQRDSYYRGLQLQLQQAHHKLSIYQQQINKLNEGIQQLQSRLSQVSKSREQLQKNNDREMQHSKVIEEMNREMSQYRIEKMRLVDVVDGLEKENIQWGNKVKELQSALVQLTREYDENSQSLIRQRQQLNQSTNRYREEIRIKDKEINKLLVELQSRTSVIDGLNEKINQMSLVAMQIGRGRDQIARLSQQLQIKSNKEQRMIHDYEELKHKEQKLRQQLEHLQQENNKLIQQLAITNSSTQSTNSRVVQLQKDNYLLRQQIEEYERRVNLMQEQIQGLRNVEQRNIQLVRSIEDVNGSNQMLLNRVDELERELKLRIEKNEQINEEQQWKERVSILQQKNQSYKGQIESLRVEMERMTVQVNRLTEQRRLLQEQNTHIKQILTSMQSQLIKLSNVHQQKQMELRVSLQKLSMLEKQNAIIVQKSIELEQVYNSLVDQFTGEKQRHKQNQQSRMGLQLRVGQLTQKITLIQGVKQQMAVEIDRLRGQIIQTQINRESMVQTVREAFLGEKLQMEREVERLRRQNMEIRNELQVMRRQREMLEESSLNKERQIQTNVDTQLGRQQENIEKIRQLQQQLDALSGELSSKKQQIDTLSRQLSQLRGENGKLEQQLQQQYKSVEEKYQQELIRAKQEHEELQRQYEAMEQSQRTLSEELGSSLQLMEEMKATIQIKEKLINELKMEKEQLKLQSQGKLLQMDNQIETIKARHRQLIEEKQNEIIGLRKQLIGKGQAQQSQKQNQLIKEMMAELENKNDHLNRELINMRDVNYKLVEQNNKLDRDTLAIEENNTFLKQQLVMLNQQVLRLRNQLQTLSRQNNSLKQQTTQLTSTLTASQQQLSNYRQQRHKQSNIQQLKNQQYTMLLKRILQSTNIQFEDLKMESSLETLLEKGSQRIVRMKKMLRDEESNRKKVTYERAMFVARDEVVEDGAESGKRERDDVQRVGDKGDVVVRAFEVRVLENKSVSQPKVNQALQIQQLPVTRLFLQPQPSSLPSLIQSTQYSKSPIPASNQQFNLQHFDPLNQLNDLSIIHHSEEDIGDENEDSMNRSQNGGGLSEFGDVEEDQNMSRSVVEGQDGGQNMMERRQIQVKEGTSSVMRNVLESTPVKSSSQDVQNKNIQQPIITKPLPQHNQASTPINQVQIKDQEQQNQLQQFASIQSQKMSQSFVSQTNVVDDGLRDGDKSQQMMKESNGGSALREGNSGTQELENFEDYKEGQSLDSSIVSESNMAKSDQHQRLEMDDLSQNRKDQQKSGQRQNKHGINQQDLLSDLEGFDDYASQKMSQSMLSENNQQLLISPQKSTKQSPPLSQSDKKKPQHGKQPMEENMFGDFDDYQSEKMSESIMSEPDG